MPVFPTPERAVRALGMLYQVSIPKHKVERAPLCKPLNAPTHNATEAQLKDALASVGVQIPHSVVISDRNQILPAITKVGGRAVMKSIVPGMLHKSEAGAVILDVTAKNAVEVYEKLSRIDKNAESNSVLVETFIPKGIETLVGITSSDVGKILTIGIGGVLTELIADISVRILPVDEPIINEMIDETRLGALFAGVRGSNPADRKAFIDAVLRITDAVIDWPIGSELDINPLTVLSKGAWVLDAAYVSATSALVGGHG